MKKIALGLLSIGVISLTACKKDDKKVAENTWTFDGTTYSAASAYFDSASASLAIVSLSGYACGFHFQDGAPVKDGVYTIVEDGNKISSGEVLVSAIKPNGSGTGYLSIAGTTEKVTVSSSGGKIIVSVGEIKLKNISGGTDELPYSANKIKQTN
jgi:hypothetical protein